MIRYISFLIMLTLWLNAVEAQAKPQAPLSGLDWSKYEVIIYDAETIAKINAPVKTVPAQTISQTSPVVIPQTLPQAQPQAEPIATPARSIETAAITDNLTPHSPDTTFTPPVTTAINTSENTPIKRDISALITRHNHKDVPIIEGAPECTSTELAIRINITKIGKQKGSLVIDLHDDNPEHFLKSSKVLLRIRQAVTGKEMSVCMPIEMPGQYAVGIYHDSNNNEKFDKNFLGIPKEHFGASNNPKFGLSKPPIDGSLFEVTEMGADISLRMTKASDIL